jgi:hypothetical protein
MNTTVNSSYNVNNLMTIDINNENSTNNQNIGSLILTYQNGYGESSNSKFNINNLLNGLLTGVYESFQGISIQIKFIGLFDDPEFIKNIRNDGYIVPNTQMALVSIYFGNYIITEFISYKVYNNRVGAELYRIIKSGYFNLNNPSPVFDFPTYNIIINSYQFPANYISFQFGTVNSTIQQIIQNKYFGNIQFSIQRVFKSPTGNEIITKASNPISLNAISNNQIPQSIQIVPFENDKQQNNLTHFFQPIATIIYFYKFVNVEKNYGFNNQINTVPSAVLNLQNNSNNMFNDKIQYNNLNTVYNLNNYEFNMTYLTRVNSNLESNTVIPFSIIYNLL